MLLLAFEISPTKARPRYCFFPFDLKNASHRNYLVRISKTGKINLCFLVGSRRIVRTHEVPPNRCKRMAELYATAIADLEKAPVDTYHFERAVAEFDQNVRVVDYFEYVLSDTELQRVVASSRAQAANVSSEDKVQAAKIAGNLLAIFRSRPNDFVREQLTQLLSIGRAFRQKGTCLKRPHTGQTPPFC